MVFDATFFIIACGRKQNDRSANQGNSELAEDYVDAVWCIVAKVTLSW